jgi:hypothetical protein
MDLKKRYDALKYNRNFEKLNVEFLIITLAEKIEYILLVLTAMAVLHITTFNLNPAHFPDLSISGELAKIHALGYNPITIYGHFIWVFFLVTKGFALGFLNTVRSESSYAIITALIIVNIWLAYSKMKYGYDNSSSKRHNVFLDMIKDYLFSSTLIERSLWTLFFIDLMTFLTQPSRNEIYFMIILYGLILSVKLIPAISRMIIDLSNRVEHTFLANEYVQIGVAVVDVILVYFDSTSIFTLLLIVITYNAVAQLVFKALKGAKAALRVTNYLFNIGTFIFFGSLVAIYLISYAVVLIIQSPLIALYYYKNKRFLPAWMMEVVNGGIIAVLLYRIIF